MFELVKVLELDIVLGDDLIPVRIEILQDSARNDFFRCRIWELEHFRLVPTFPMDEDGKPLHISDDVIQVERSSSYQIFNKLEYRGFVATNAEAAMQMVMDDLKSYLEHTTLESPEQA